MSDLREYETIEVESGNAGKIVGAPEATMSDLRGPLTPEVETGNAAKIVGAPEAAMSDLRGPQMPEEESGNTGKIAAAIVIALMIGVVGAYFFGAGMWSSPPKQVVASNEVPPTPLPPSVAPTQQTAVAPLAPVENAPAQTSAPETTVPPVRAMRTHVSARASFHALAVQPSENLSDEAPAASVPPAVSVPVQPAPLDTTIVAPVIAPLPDAPTQSTPAQPAQIVPAQPATQP
ncbi:MAG: hypothetical protein WCA78_04610 [Rhizomicrobium sp.]